MTGLQKTMPDMDPSLLRIVDGTPVKVTYLQSAAGNHFVGFYTFDGAAFKDIRTVFPSTGRETLIAGVSSVFLGSRLNGKTPVFFVIENGYALNKGAEWFNDAVNGKNGFWRFVAPADHKDAVLEMRDGRLVWVDTAAGIVEDAADAVQLTGNPVLVWQSVSGKLFPVKGRVYHSYGYGLTPSLNPDEARHAVLSPENPQSGVVLSFCGIAGDGTDLTDHPLVRLRLQIGERNFAALTRNRIVGVLEKNPDKNELFSAAKVDIQDDFGDSLYLEGFEEQQTVPLSGTTFDIEKGEASLTVRGTAKAALYEALLSRVRVRTKTTVPFDIGVTVRLTASSGREVVCSGKISILASEVNGASVPVSVVVPTVTPAIPQTEKPHNFFADIGARVIETESSAELPSFLTEMPVVPVMAAPKQKQQVTTGKTALIAGGARLVGGLITKTLAAKGYNVIIHCHTAVADAARLAEEARRNYGVKSAYVRADFELFDETADLIPSVVKTYGTIDVLIDCACSRIDLESGGDEDCWRRNTALNLRAPAMLMQAFAKQLPKGREGTAVFVFEQTPESADPYALASAGLETAVRRWAKMSASRIRVNAIGCLPSKNGEDIAKAVEMFTDSSVLTGQVLFAG